ncbi:hypothetical protein GCM10023187_57490 [Nibrella viscosa]|uniref:Exosortase/archaeosortase family protein n=1 Tax=Nibrella viscosa TaxID=1084524 RepID=A0ABP8L3P2_9BACT
MVHTLAAFFYRIASWKLLLLTIPFYLAFPGYFFKTLETRMNAYAGQTIGPIDLLMGNFDPDKILEMVAAYGPEGRPYYAFGELTADLAYPIIYTFLLCVSLSLLFRQKPYTPFYWVNVLPVAIMLSDFLENSLIVTLLNTYPDTSRSVAILCMVFTNLKWTVFFLVVGLILYGLARLLLSRLSRANPSKRTEQI